MYEFHGWIKLAESPREIDEGSLEGKIDELRLHLDQYNWSSGKTEILLLNGFYVLQLNAIPNRRRTEAVELRNILDFIVTKFGGAYGLVYEYDESTATEYGRGVFSVNVIKRGKCETVMDPFLSPVIPVVEDLS